MWARKVSHKIDIFYVLYKKDKKKSLDKWIILAPKIVFFTKTQNMSVFAETTL
jgi:hypothetical protein